MPALLAPDDAANPTPYVVYVLLWVGLVPASLLLGPVVRLLSPLRALHAGLAALLRIDPDGERPLPDLGWWPAAVGLAGFTWLELVAPDSSSSRLLVVLAATYGALQVAAGLVYGRAWFRRGELFEAYSDLVGRLAPLGRRDDGVLVVRNPLDGLATLGAERGLVATVAVLLGSTAFDSVSGLTSWIDAVQASALPEVVWGTAGLAATIAVVVVSYRLGTPVTAPGAGPDPRSVPGLFAHSLVPIVVGYVVAHYFSLFVFEGWRAILLLNDPFVRGSNWLGLAGGQVDYGLLSVGTIAVTQVGAIVVGHVVGVVAAHDRAVALYPPRAATRGQVPLLAVMVFYTGAGILLLFAQ